MPRTYTWLGRLQGVEASLYAGLMSVSNAGQNSVGALIALVSQLVGVTATDTSRTYVLVLTAQVRPPLLDTNLDANSVLAA